MNQVQKVRDCKVLLPLSVLNEPRSREPLRKIALVIIGSKRGLPAQEAVAEVVEGQGLLRKDWGWASSVIHGPSGHAHSFVRFPCD